ncbi:HSP20-like chaperone [Tricharina praecox]|uniref:HSP20-like chaperone n=1 Tax=Tricharina praecox TaxID=43433 RepID=UPI0022201D8A|nr:HSP20-like chaperone [Tricharina praecox]KAI5858044.1 HSP20-like chaperone [Tricharina praecox]
MSAPVTPEVLWAQRSSIDDDEKNVVYLTITAADIPKDSLKVELTATKLSFSGENKWRKYALDLEFYAEIDEKLSKTHHSGRGVEFVLRKKEIKAEFWPRLAKEPKKLQFIKTDFNKWVDEDEQDEAEEPAIPAGNDMDGDMDGGMGGMGGGMGGLDFAKMMGGQGGAGGMGGMDMASMMQGMGGAGGMGGMDMASMMQGMGGVPGGDDDDVRNSLPNES